MSTPPTTSWICYTASQMDYVERLRFSFIAGLVATVLAPLHMHVSCGLVQRPCRRQTSIFVGIGRRLS